MYVSKRLRAGIGRAGFAALVAACALGTTPGCNDQDAGEASGVRAKRITSPDEIIGGPTSRGKVGDFLLENDHVRFIVSGMEGAKMGGPFGGTLIDADRARGRADERYGKGWDAFAETFPLVNLVVTNPHRMGHDVSADETGWQIDLRPGDVELVSDGSDGKAIVRVTGQTDYMFEMLKFLNKEFLAGFLAEPIEFNGLELPIDELLSLLLDVNVFDLLSRLQVDFHFQHDFILEPDDQHLTMKTTFWQAPASEGQLTAHCPQVTCGAGDPPCEDGFALEEVAYEIDGKDVPGKVMCPVCACAAPAREMPTLNERENIFGIILGDLDYWKDPTWKGGLLSGDFLFFGGEVNVFSPGLGFDEMRRIFENQWQQVPTLASPLMFDWIAGVAENVSYAWVTRNPERRLGRACPTQQVVLAALGYADLDETIAILEANGFTHDVADGAARQAVVDHRPLLLQSGVAVPSWVASDADFEAWRADVLADFVLSPDPGDPSAPRLADGQPASARLALIEATECQPGRLLIPIFSTSATAVLTHKYQGSLDTSAGAPRDTERSFSFERYFVVGDGDVGSALETVYRLKGYETGHVRGVVVDGDSSTPAHHASVLAIRDPRSSADDPAPETYDELRAMCREAFAEDGIVSQMQTDVGLDPVHDGDYSGPLEPGRYFLVAFGRERGVSRPVAVEITADRTEVVHLAIPQSGGVHFRVQDQGGLATPCRLTFIALDQAGDAYDWDGLNRVELGGGRWDHGVHKIVHSVTGEGMVDLPAGRYEIYVSRGFEYSIAHWDEVEVRAGQVVPLQAALIHEVDTTGFVSGDFHVHARPSVDSGFALEERLKSYLAEGVEYAVSSDHDILTDYQPIIHKLSAEAFVQTDVGVETTTLDFGHYNGYPMKFDAGDPAWHGAPPWYGLGLDAVFAGMRERRAEGLAVQDFIVQANHPRDGIMGYFSQIGLSGYDLERKTPGMMMCGPQTEVAPCDFDTVEVMNEKRFELIRTPTLREFHEHNACYGEILGATRPEAFALHADEGGAEIGVCAELQRPPYADCPPPPEAECWPDACGPTVDAACAAAMDVAGGGLDAVRVCSRADDCAWHAEFAASMARCGPDTDLVVCKKLALDALKLLSVRKELDRTPEEQAAYFEASSWADPGWDYETAMAACPAGASAKDAGQLGCGNQPSIDEQAVLDDWFSFLNHGLMHDGFFVTGLGNSDSHDSKKEVGLPRNYVQSSTDDPAAIDPLEIYRNIKAHRVVVSTGPFIRASIDGAGIGGTLTAPTGDTLEVDIEVQTASWFGIDHIEIYRNGRMEWAMRLAPAVADIVDFDRVVQLPMPTEDSWYVVIVYGLDGAYLLSPIYKRVQHGHLLITSVIALGAQSLLSAFPQLMGWADDSGLDVNELLGGLFGSAELPDVFPQFPFAFTNPIWVDVDGDGFTPPLAKDADGDGLWDLPPFCSRPCEVALVEGPEGPDGPEVPGQSTCGRNQICSPHADGADTGTCIIPIPANCPRNAL